MAPIEPPQNSPFTWVLWTEFCQNRLHFLLAVCVSFFLGFGVHLSIQAERWISELMSGVSWNADLVVLPKGMSLRDLKNEVLTGQTTAFLPEALFNTILEMSEGHFHVGAFLALTDSQGSRVMIRGNASEIGFQWLKGRQSFAPWLEQNLYRTPEWGNKLIGGFFAQGSQDSMLQLKTLIDKKTVAQAFLIQDQIQSEEKLQFDLQRALAIYGGIFGLVICLAFFLLGLWIKERFANSFLVFEELGLSRRFAWQVSSSLLTMAIVFPIFLGFLVASFLHLNSLK